MNVVGGNGVITTGCFSMRMLPKMTKAGFHNKKHPIKRCMREEIIEIFVFQVI
jgi:hypothetical protein